MGILGQNRRRREETNFARFKALVAAPGNLATGVTLPAGVKLYASSSSALAAISPMITANSITTSAPVSQAGEARPMGYFQRDTVVIKAAGAVGTISLYVQDGVGKLYKIAQG